MTNDIIDLLQVRIEKAKMALPAETVGAIDAVDWRAAILGLRNKHGYTFEQLGDLELETELILCGLTDPADYPKELESRMKISKAQANELVNEMNDLVFKKIREELIKNVERKRVFADKKTKEEKDTQILNSAGIKIIAASAPSASAPKIEKPVSSAPLTQQMQEGKLELETTPERSPSTDDVGVAETSVPASEETHPMLAQKLSATVQTPTVETEHTLDNISKTSMPDSANAKPKIPSVDPYREIPE